MLKSKVVTSGVAKLHPALIDYAMCKNIYQF